MCILLKSDSATFSVFNLCFSNVIEEEPLVARLDSSLGTVRVNPIQAGGAHYAPTGFFPCCAKTASGRLMKLSDFYYNYIGHHLK